MHFEYLTEMNKNINKMNKIMNCEAIQPTKKPLITHRSHQLQSNQSKTPSDSLSNRNKFRLQDCVKQTSNEPLNSTGFKQKLLSSKEQDLASSFSFSDQEAEYEYQRLLFSKFLQAKESDWMHFMHDMNKISHQNLLSFVKIGQSEKSVNLNSVLSHYIGVWLQSMGYKDTQTRKKLVATVGFLYPDERDSVVKIATILYDTLFQGYLPEFLQLRLLLEVCKRGWEYFGFFIAKFIKILKKNASLKEENFICEVQMALI